MKFRRHTANWEHKVWQWAIPAFVLGLAAAESRQETMSKIVAAEVMMALGGHETWNAIRYVDFAFVRRGNRLVLKWDRWTRDYRLDATNEDAQPVRVVMNLATGEGDVRVAGEPVSSEAKAEWLNRATRMWHGESYWLLMPLKLSDPGVKLTYEGRKEVAGTDYDVLGLAFDEVGVTPGDTFRVYVHPETRLVDRWTFKLQGGYEGDFRWTGWKEIGGLQIATERHGVDGEIIRMEDITLATEVPDGVFSFDAP